eukprot:GHVN01035376.1.p1 GENE.GHVN01035376.1~~GHVN01035376.1.p1  ORF type:complete len:1234 (+),score=165.84 GHVN01035376.1:409-4110(+)
MASELSAVATGPVLPDNSGSDTQDGVSGVRASPGSSEVATSVLPLSNEAAPFSPSAKIPNECDAHLGSPKKEFSTLSSDQVDRASRQGNSPGVQKVASALADQPSLCELFINLEPLDSLADAISDVEGHADGSSRSKPADEVSSPTCCRSGPTEADDGDKATLLPVDSAENPINEPNDVEEGDRPCPGFGPAMTEEDVLLPPKHANSAPLTSANCWSAPSGAFSPSSRQGFPVPGGPAMVSPRPPPIPTRPVPSSCERRASRTQTLHDARTGNMHAGSPHMSMEERENPHLQRSPSLADTPPPCLVKIRNTFLQLQPDRPYSRNAFTLPEYSAEKSMKHFEAARAKPQPPTWSTTDRRISASDCYNSKVLTVTEDLNAYEKVRGKAIWAESVDGMEEPKDHIQLKRRACSAKRSTVKLKDEGSKGPGEKHEGMMSTGRNESLENGKSDHGSSNGMEFLSSLDSSYTATSFATQSGGVTRDGHSSLLSSSMRTNSYFSDIDPRLAATMLESIGSMASTPQSAGSHPNQGLVGPRWASMASSTTLGSLDQHHSGDMGVYSNAMASMPTPPPGPPLPSNPFEFGYHLGRLVEAANSSEHPHMLNADAWAAAAANEVPLPGCSGVFPHMPQLGYHNPQTGRGNHGRNGFGPSSVSLPPTPPHPSDTSQQWASPMSLQGRWAGVATQAPWYPRQHSLQPKRTQTLPSDVMKQNIGEVASEAASGPQTAGSIEGSGGQLEDDYEDDGDEAGSQGASSSERRQTPAEIVAGMTEEQLNSMIPRDKDGNLTSIGSIRHSTGDCKACVFQHNPKKQTCKNGPACTFCHFKHAKKKASRPSKIQRMVMRALKEQAAAAQAAQGGQQASQYAQAAQGGQPAPQYAQGTSLPGFPQAARLGASPKSSTPMNGYATHPPGHISSPTHQQLAVNLHQSGGVWPYGAALSTLSGMGGALDPSLVSPSSGGSLPAANFQAGTIGTPTNSNGGMSPQQFQGMFTPTAATNGRWTPMTPSTASTFQSPTTPANNRGRAKLHGANNQAASADYPSTSRNSGSQPPQSKGSPPFGMLQRNEEASPVAVGHPTAGVPMPLYYQSMVAWGEGGELIDQSARSSGALVGVGGQTKAQPAGFHPAYPYLYSPSMPSSPQSNQANSHPPQLMSHPPSLAAWQLFQVRSQVALAQGNARHQFAHSQERKIPMGPLYPVDSSNDKSLLHTGGTPPLKNIRGKGQGTPQWGSKRGRQVDVQ